MQERVRLESEKLVEQAKAANWDRLRRLYLEKKQVLLTEPQKFNEKATSPTGLMRRAKPLIAGNAKVESLMKVVHKLNEARLTNATFSPALSFKQVSGSEDRLDLLPDCWDALSVIANETSSEGDQNIFIAATSQSSPFADSYQKGLLDWDLQLIKGSKRFLELIFSKYMDSTIAMYPREAMLGGKPGVIEHARAFASIKMKRMSVNELDRLDMAPIDTTSIPYWLVLWCLVRAGALTEALEWIQSPSVESFVERTEPYFISYFKSFVSGTLAGNALSQLRSEYAQKMILPHDPYKLAVLKLIGRCDLAKKSIPEVIQTSEDYLWLQLCLVRPNDDLYSLSDLQKIVRTYGPAHFDPKGMQPLRYFQILLLVGLFEEAVAYLYQGPYQMEAVHFAICLAYHGILKVPDNPSSILWDMALKKGDSTAINYGILLAQFAKMISSTFDTIQGLEYIFLITLIPEYTKFSHQLVRDLIVESNDAASLLGDVKQDGTIAPGYLAKHSRLLGLSSTDSSFMKEITVKAAEKCEADDRLSDALQLYNLASDYTRVINLLLKSLAKTSGNIMLCTFIFRIGE